MRMSDAKYLVASTMAVLLLAGCGGSTLFSSPSVGQQNQSRIKGSTSSCPCLYAPIQGAIIIWALGAGGKVTQIGEISGSKTKFGGYGDVAFDKQGNLYVANPHNRNSYVTVFAAGATGNVAPIRTIKGPATGLIGSDGIAFDRHNDEIYVANGGNNHRREPGSITTYPGNVHGDVAPLRTITGGVYYPLGLTLDTSGTLYVPNGATYYTSPSFISVYAAGSVVPTRTIEGSRTKLLLPSEIALDSSGNIYVVNGDSASGYVTVYPPGANGNVAPIDTIGGSHTMLDYPIGIALDSSNNIYVSNYGSNLITVYAAGSKGNVAPINTIAVTSPLKIRIRRR